MRSRLGSLILLMLAAALGVVLVACDPPAPAPRELTAAEILDRTSAQMKTVEAVHFQMEMAGGTMTLGPGFKISRLEGDVARPDKVRLQTKSTLGGFVLDVEMVSVGGKQFLKNPLSKQWEPIQVDLRAANLLDPEKGALTILRQARDLKKLPNEDLDGVKVYHIVGTVPSSAITDVTGGAPSGADDTIDAWIGVDDYLLRKVVVSGSVLEGESTDLVRTITFSQFNQTVNIEIPQ